MKLKYLRNEHGVAMLFELLLVAAALAIVGVAVYQTNHKPASVASAPLGGATPTSAQGLAANAASASEQAAASDASLSTGANSAGNQVTQTSTDVSNLEGSSNASF